MKKNIKTTFFLNSKLKGVSLFKFNQTSHCAVIGADQSERASFQTQGTTRGLNAEGMHCGTWRV